MEKATGNQSCIDFTVLPSVSEADLSVSLLGCDVGIDDSLDIFVEQEPVFPKPTFKRLPKYDCQDPSFQPVVNVAKLSIDKVSPTNDKVSPTNFVETLLIAAGSRKSAAKANARFHPYGKQPK